MAPYPEWPLAENLARAGLQRLVGHGQERPASDKLAEAYESYEPALQAPQRWGLSAEAVANLGDCLYQFWLRFRGCFTTRTRNPSKHAYGYLRAQLTMDTARNFANMDRTLTEGTDKPCSTSWPTRLGQAKRYSARCRRSSRLSRPWPTGAR